MSRRTIRSFTTMLFPTTRDNRLSREAAEDLSSTVRPLTALALIDFMLLQALIQEREASARKRTIASVSWLPDVIRVRGSIVPHIIGPVLTVTLFAIFVGLISLAQYFLSSAAATRFYNLPLRLSNSVVPLLSVVVGLLLVFRNGSAYERYSEGRKDFTTLVSAARNLSRLVWVQVALPSEALTRGRDLNGGDGNKGKYVGSKELMTAEVLKGRKIRFIKLVNAFIIAVKHHLRGEAGTNYEDYQGVLPSDFTRYDTIANENRTLHKSSLSSSALASEATLLYLESQTLKTTSERQTPHHRFGGGLARHFRQLSSAVVPHAVDERTPFLGREPSDWMNAVRPVDSAGGAGNNMPLPLVIAHDLSRSLFAFRREGTLEITGPAGVNAMQGLIQTMIDQMGAMERVVRTTLPPIFQVHLKQCVTLYLLSLPLVLVDDMGWLMVFVVSLVAFTLMGVEGIAAQVENPFGTESNDLPLDLEVAELRVELEYVYTTLPEGTDDEDVFSI